MEKEETGVYFSQTLLKGKIHERRVPGRKHRKWLDEISEIVTGKVQTTGLTIWKEHRYVLIVQ